MRRLLSGAAAAALGLWAGAADAKPGRCVLQVHGRTYLNGMCNVTMEDKDGSFSIGTGKHRSRYFAYVTMEDGGGHGYWNETPSSTHAHTDLGLLKRDGACWTNDTARVCAYR